MLICTDVMPFLFGAWGRGAGSSLPFFACQAIPSQRSLGATSRKSLMFPVGDGISGRAPSCPTGLVSDGIISMLMMRRRHTGPMAHCTVIARNPRDVRLRLVVVA